MNHQIQKEQTFSNTQEVLETKGFLVLPQPFEIGRVRKVHNIVQNSFNSIKFDDEVLHRTLYEIDDTHEGNVDPRFYERGKVAVPRIDFKSREGYRQLMMSLDFSMEFAYDWIKDGAYKWGKTHGSDQIKKSDIAFASIIDLFSTQAMSSIFSRTDPDQETYCGFLLNDSAPHSVCFGYHYELHQDQHQNAIVVSVQLSPQPTEWKIGRNLDNLETLVQEQGSMVVMEAFDYENRASPWHMPCIGDSPRNAAVVVFAGLYRDRFVRWLEEHATACGYITQ